MTDSLTLSDTVNPRISAFPRISALSQCRTKLKISASPRISAPPLPLFYGRELRQQRMYSFDRVQAQENDYRLIQALQIDRRNG